MAIVRGACVGTALVVLLGCAADVGDESRQDRIERTQGALAFQRERGFGRGNDQRVSEAVEPLVGASAVRLGHDGDQTPDPGLGHHLIVDDNRPPLGQSMGRLDQDLNEGAADRLVGSGAGQNFR